MASYNLTLLRQRGRYLIHSEGKFGQHVQNRQNRDTQGQSLTAAWCSSCHHEGVCPSEGSAVLHYDEVAVKVLQMLITSKVNSASFISCECLTRNCLLHLCAGLSAVTKVEYQLFIFRLLLCLLCHFMILQYSYANLVFLVAHTVNSQLCSSVTVTVTEVLF